MKTITPYLLRFTLVILVLAFVFRYSLSYMIGQHSFSGIWLIAILYFFAMFSAGWFLGKKDGEYLPIYDVGFRFHFTTYLIHNGVSELWFFLGFNSPNESIKVVHTTALIWGFFLLVHLFFYLRARKNSINDLNKTDLFE